MGTQCDDSACVSFPAENVNNLPRVSRTTQVGTFRESPRKCHCVRRKKSSTSGKKEDAVETWTTVLLDFSQNTTIHALRQITEPTPYVLRRMLWVSILLTGVSLFVMQTVESTARYLSRPATVSIRMRHNHSVRFPAVTLCNQNAFRLTKMVELGYYQHVSEIFAADYETTLNDSYKSAFSTNTTMQDLYDKTAHSKSDLIVDCHWNRRPCRPDDFLTTLTDHGVCYTFNSGRQGQNTRHVTQAGAEIGLRLRLNLEQYEYMRGPTKGAGLRMLVHDPDEVPLVSDLGQAVPPGAHAFVGIQIQEVHNLKPPYGKCTDDQQLEFYPLYTPASCLLDCQQRFLLMRCHCRNFYMPERPLGSGFPAVCSVRDYVTCVRPSLELFSEFSEFCSCPTTCRSTLYNPTITYGANSNFDLEKMLRTERTAMQTRNTAARETLHRVDRDIAAEDETLIAALERSILGLEATFDQIAAGITWALAEMSKKVSDIKTRAEFHEQLALGKVKYRVDRDFVGGWHILRDRTLSHVTTGIYEMTSSVERVVSRINRTLDESDVKTRGMLWFLVDNDLANRLELVHRARLDLQRANLSFTVAQPIIKFPTHDNPRYEQTYIPLELFQVESQRLKLYFSQLANHLVAIQDTIESMRRLGQQFIETKTLDRIALGSCTSRFITECKGYNARLFLLQDRVIRAPQRSMSRKMTEFKRLLESLESKQRRVRTLSGHTQQFLNDTRKGFWREIKSAGKFARLYRRNLTISKTELVGKLTSKRMTENIHHMIHFFHALRSRGHVMRDALHQVASSYESLLVNMALESSTRRFYQKIYTDILEMKINTSMQSLYIPIFKYMLKRNTNLINRVEATGFMKTMNADFAEMNLSTKQVEISRDFHVIAMGSNIEKLLGDWDEDFLKSISMLRDSLQQYARGNEIDFEFFKQNYLNLDVFMREMIYEEISQRVAYDLTNLWSDIGGSIGLFVGASVITAFEILDVFIHNVFKRNCLSHNKRPLGTNGCQPEKEGVARDDREHV